MLLVTYGTASKRSRGRYVPSPAFNLGADFVSQGQVTPTLMPNSLLHQMESLAASRNIASPSEIIHWSEIQRLAKQPKRPKRAYWMRDE